MTGDGADQEDGRGFDPLAGRVLHLVGQSREQIEDYISRVTDYGRACPLPAGAAAYTALTTPLLEGPRRFGAGNTQDVGWLLEQPWCDVLQLALHVQAAELEPAGHGDLDDNIRRLADELRRVSTPVLLRIGYEFDGPHNRYDPALYRVAYQRIVDCLREHGVENAAFVWHSYAWFPTYDGHDLSAWYPGDDYVDWFGMSVFDLLELGHNRARVLQEARKRGRPVIVCESAPIRVGRREDVAGEDDWATWHKPILDLLAGNPDIKAITLINANFDDVEKLASLGWGDARFHADAHVLQRWRRELTRPTFVHHPEAAELLRTWPRRQGGRQP